MVRKGARRGATPELKSQSSPSSVAPRRLVLCLLNGWCFAARIFPSRRGASDEHIPQWICKERATKPGAKRTAALWVAPSLACGFVARRSQPHCGGCSLLAPRHRPNWAQQNTSHLGDTTPEPVAKVRFVQERRCPHPRIVRKTPATFPRMWASAL